MEILTIVLLCLVLVLVAALAVLMMRQDGRRDAQRMREQLALALSQQAETVLLKAEA